MSNIEEEGFVVVITEGPVGDGHESTDVIVVFKGQAEHNDEMVEITFGVDPETAQDIISTLAHPLDDGEYSDEPYVLYHVELWQVLTGPMKATSDD